MAKTLSELSQEYIEYLVQLGKSERTCYTYGMDLACLIKFFGPDLPVEKITALSLGKFFKSDVLLIHPKVNRPRAEITVAKNIRVVRQFCLWLYQTRVLDSLPLPKYIPLGRDASKLNA